MNCNKNKKNNNYTVHVKYINLYYGRVLVAMVPFDVLQELYAHNIRLDKFTLLVLTVTLVGVLIKAFTEFGCVWLLP